MAERLTREQQRWRNRMKLLAAAERLFADRGITGASMDDVAAEAGLTKGAVYSNFANKEELVMQVLWQQAGTPENAEAQKLFSSGRSPEEIVDDYGTLWAATVRSEERADYSKVALEYIAHALREPRLRAELAAFIFPPKEHGAGHAFQRPGTEFAKLDSDRVQTLVTALSIGFGALTLIDQERCPPELFGTALRLMAGMPVDPTQLPPPSAETSGEGGDAARDPS
ncbi:AcrR family transcriptional regulator [Lipingzhangella halophila]|uniref:AcrR family transcriptional regulator n=1 Tax=Lipingzhangella halophila TaxID=1783352 RepID=A0A7W7RD74_9ACTN|nr:TetR/AcrR family transcriptional regulator [Lipingzhangella halophila]MBB4929630.1 AcrR family transcriptional regulator [Lipingzhangella halophila]